MESSKSAPTWGEGVRQLRELHNISQVQLAKKVGCSQAAISRLEKGVSRHLSDAVRLRIAKALHVDPHRLFPYEDNRRSDNESDVA